MDAGIFQDAGLRRRFKAVEEELQNCDEFCISVAFITQSGIEPLLQVYRIKNVLC